MFFAQKKCGSQEKDYLKGRRTFYFDANPQEIYLVTFTNESRNSIKDAASKTAIKIIAYETKEMVWSFGQDHSRIQKRFDEEIISKLEYYTKTTLENE